MRSILSFCLALLSALLLLTSCDDDEDDSATIERADATLVWSNPAADGCGFSLLIGQEAYKPVNESAIDKSYKAQTTTAVEATFISLSVNPLSLSGRGCKRTLPRSGYPCSWMYL